MGLWSHRIGDRRDTGRTVSGIACHFYHIDVCRCRNVEGNGGTAPPCAIDHSSARGLIENIDIAGAAVWRGQVTDRHSRVGFGYRGDDRFLTGLTQRHLVLVIVYAEDIAIIVIDLAQTAKPA